MAARRTDVEVPLPIFIISSKMQFQSFQDINSIQYDSSLSVDQSIKQVSSIFGSSISDVLLQKFEDRQNMMNFFGTAGFSQTPREGRGQFPSLV